MPTALQTTRLTKRYGRSWGLRECSLAVPAGKIVALVGPNGAGKTTLLNLAVGLLRPTSGEIAIFDHSPTKDTMQVLKRIGFVAQDHPLYRNFTVAEMLHTARLLNTRWDDAFARARLDQLDIALTKQVGKLSGGQQAQVALILALAKHPDLLLFDEPLASLDPLARRNFLRLMQATTEERETTVLLSSHIISDLERVCDYLIILADGTVRLTGDIAAVLAEHCFVTDAMPDSHADQYTIIERVTTNQGTKSLVRLTGHPHANLEPSSAVQPTSLEDITLAYLGQAQESSRVA